MKKETHKGKDAGKSKDTGKRRKKKGAASLDEVRDQDAPTETTEAAEGTETAEAAVDPGKELEARVAELEAEAAAAADRALRTLAEFDNFRRRSHREREEAATRGMAEVLRDLLDVADNFDRALDHAGDDVPASFLEGMSLVARGLHELLDRKGVARMEADGALFDPERHDALTRQPTEDVTPNTVMQVVQPGYMLHERVLRPAKVIVAAPMPSVVDAPASDDGGEVA